MKKFIRVDDWKPNKEDIKIYNDGKLMIVPFNKIFNKNNITTLNNFIIKKDSYVKQTPQIQHYINYFIKYYDTDNELLLSYLKLKFIIDNKKKSIHVDNFIKLLYNILFTDTMKENIIKMVEDNYYIDLTSSTGIKYSESLEFTEDHAKVMMQISISMKIMIPVMFHYLNTYGLIKERKYIYRFYEHLFDIYGDDIDIYNKLYITVYSGVNVHSRVNKLSWDQREIFGTVPPVYNDQLLKDKIISETMFRYIFSKNIVSLNHVVYRNQLGYFSNEAYDENRIELSSDKDSQGLSGLDKLEMNSAKIDESIVILSEINIKKTIKRIEKKMKLKISKNEIEYYKHNMKITKFQSQLVFYFYAKYFNGYRDLNLLTRKQYLKLLIILKKRLQYQNYIYLPQILTANIESKLNTRTIQNNKFLSKIQSSSIYQSIIDDKYSTLDDIDKPNLILNLLSSLLNTTFTFVDYEHQDMIGLPIEVNQDMVSDEFLNLLNQF